MDVTMIEVIKMQKIMINVLEQLFHAATRNQDLRGSALKWKGMIIVKVECFSTNWKV